MDERVPLVRRDGEPERLLARHLAGDGDAFSRLVELFQDRLYVFLERFLSDSHLAEDVFQQTFVKVAENAAKYDGRAAFSTWLFRIARNTAVDELRRRRSPAAALPDGDRLEAVPDGGVEAPLDKLTREEQAAAARRALAAIPEAQREVFLLREEGDMTFEEIGGLLGCGKETAKSRFRLAVAKLREAFGVKRGQP